MAANSKKNPRKRPPATDSKKPRRNQLAALGVKDVDYKDVHLLRILKTDQAFEGVRSRKDFQKLVADLEASVSPLSRK